MTKVYMCERCGETFDEPYKEKEGFGHEFGYEQWENEVCPYCGCQDFFPTEECEMGCGGYLDHPDEYSLCYGCRQELLEKVVPLFKCLTKEEHQQIEQWQNLKGYLEFDKWN